MQLVLFINLIQSQTPNIKKEDKSEKKINKTHTGFCLTISQKPEFWVYTIDSKWRREEPNTKIDESDYFFSVFDENNIEFNLYYRKFQAQNIYIEGGNWNIEHQIVGTNIGKVITLKLRIPGIDLSLPIDFSGGGYVQMSFNNKYTFVNGNQNENVISNEARFGYGVYAAIKFRLEFIKEKLGFPVLGIGYKFFLPFNNFDYNRDTTASYRLTSNSLFLGIYF